MSLNGMLLNFNGDLNTGRQEQPINFAGDPDRSKSGPDLPSAYLFNGAIGSVTMAQMMENEYNQGMVRLYMGALLETLDIVKYPYDPNRMMIDDSCIILNQVWVLLKCVKLLFSEV